MAMIAAFVKVIIVVTKIKIKDKLEVAFFFNQLDKYAQ